MARKDKSDKKLRQKKTTAAETDTKSQLNSTRQKKKKIQTTRRGTGNKDSTKKKAEHKKKYDHDKPATDEQKENFIKFLNQLYGLGINGILNQYSTGLKAYVPEGITRQAFDKNMDKNRYKDVICVDASRVVLNDGEKNDYVHANYVTDPCLVNKFICTQGPMVNTVVDFWRMIIQESVETIIMLCETVETGKEKCQQYWPLTAGSTVEFSGISIKTLEIDTKTDTAAILSKLEVVRGNDKLTVNHYQWRTWPDRSVPQSVMAPFRLLKAARNSNACTVVHCSAGVGRTGTVVALEVCLQRLLAGKSLCVMSTVQQLRSMRMHTVQTDLQLCFINKCLTAFALSRQLVTGDLLSKHEKFDADYSKLIQERAQPENDVGYTPLVPVQGFKPLNAAAAGGGGAAPPGTTDDGVFKPMNLPHGNSAPSPVLSDKD